jgi:hypothetical protein
MSMNSARPNRLRQVLVSPPLPVSRIGFDQSGIAEGLAARVRARAWTVHVAAGRVWEAAHRLDGWRPPP